MSPLPVGTISRQRLTERQLERYPQLGVPKWWAWPSENGEWYHDRPEIVTLCGSTRFVEQFNYHSAALTRIGVIVLSIELVTTQIREEDPQHVNRPNKQMLDALHFEKIKISDRIFVLNVEGYIGESTANEIGFAQSIGVPVTYLRPDLVVTAPEL